MDNPVGISNQTLTQTPAVTPTCAKIIAMTTIFLGEFANNRAVKAGKMSMPLISRLPTA